MALELEDSQPFLNTSEPSHDSATCRANLEVAIENDSAAEFSVKSRIISRHIISQALRSWCEACGAILLNSLCRFAALERQLAIRSMGLAKHRIESSRQKPKPGTE